MRLLALTPTFFPIVGGAELLIRDVLNVWSHDHEVRLLTPRLPEESEAFWVEDPALDSTCDFPVSRFEDRLNLLKMRGHRVTRGLIPPMSVTAIGEVMREARRMEAEMLVGFFGIPYGLSLTAAGALLGLPYALVICGTDLPSPRTAPVPAWRDYLRFTTNRAAATAYVSRFCFDVLHRRPFDPRRDWVIHGGIDMRAPQNDAAALELRERLGFSPEDVMLFALQRLGPEKRVDVLIEALAALPPLPKKVRLVIGGQGPEHAALEELASRLGVRERVVFTGHLGDEKDHYYRACDIFVFHSLFETFGQVLVEAMRAGKPIVSVRAGAIPEVVSDGRTGLLADIGDAGGIARLVARLATDDRERLAMGAAGRARGEEMFDWNLARDKWRAFIDSVPVRVRSSRQPARRAEADLGTGD